MIPNVRLIAVEILNNIELKSVYSNIEINRRIKDNQFNNADKNLLTELVYGVLQNKYTLDWIVGIYSSIKIKKISTPILNVLRIGIYQLVYLDRIPDFSAVNESVNLAKKFGHGGSVKFVNGILRTIAREKDNLKYPIKDQDPVKYFEVVYSHPKWIIEKLIKDYGIDTTEEICKANNKKSKLSIRINTLKTDKEQLLNIIKEKYSWVVEDGDFEESLLISNASGIFESQEFIDGLFVVQDQSSMLTSKILGPKPGDLIIDTCSAPGGKATHMGQLMNNEGRIISRDIYPHKINLIKDNAKKLSVKIIETQIHDALKEDLEFFGQADCVLVDAPCSGLGVLQKKPEIRWTKDAENIEELRRLQLEILVNNAKLVKDGGTLVYSTCTITKEENLDVVNKFLECNKDFYLVDICDYLPKRLVSTNCDVGYVQILQTQEGYDGFFIAKMRRREQK